MEVNRQSSIRRLEYFDFLRLLLVILALFSHFLISQGWNGTTTVGIRFLTRSAMPGLLIVFGFMMEYVYSRQLVAKGVWVVVTRLIYRAVLCYFAFVALSFIGAIGGHHTVRHAIWSFTLLEPSRFANLFKYYALLIPFVTVFLLIKNKYNWSLVMIVLFVLILAAELLKQHVIVPVYSLKHIAGLFFGIADVWGPSISHALVFVIFGMLFSEYLYGNSKRLAGTYLFSLVGLSIILLAVEIWQVGPKSLIMGIVNISVYRSTNSAVYYAYGISTFLILTALSKGSVKLLSISLIKWISYYGSNTFSIFFWANVLLLLIPFKISSNWIGLLVFLFVLLISFFITRIIDKNPDWLITTFIKARFINLSNFAVRIFKHITLSKSFSLIKGKQIEP